MSKYDQWKCTDTLGEEQDLLLAEKEYHYLFINNEFPTLSEQDKWLLAEERMKQQKEEADWDGYEQWLDNLVYMDDNCFNCHTV